ncbi:hypothetical protein KKD61_00535 [Patescibacteria group bacterium]|nr:hypothetical protein [Patescibacteria group bacterium]
MMKKNGLLKNLLIFIITIAWFFSGWPQIWPNPPIPPEIKEVKASPAEALTNGSFTGGTTGWTLSVSTYDGTTYQVGPGSVTTVTAVGRNKVATGTATHDSAISTNATDIVTLSFYWKKNYVAATPVTNTISVQIQTSGSDWSAPTTLWTDTTTGATDWTYVSQDVSSNFGTGNYDFRLYMDLKNPNNASAQTLAWFDTVSLDVVAAPVISVVITTDGTIAYGPIEGGQSKSTIDLTDTQTAQNDGSATENFNIMTSSAINGTSWTIGSSAGNNVFVHEFSTNSGGVWTKFTVADSYQTLATGVAVSGTVNFDLRITVPTDSDSTQKNITITVQAVAP